MTPDHGTLEGMQAVRHDADRLIALARERFPDATEAERKGLEFMAMSGAMIASTHPWLTTRHRSFEELVLHLGNLSRWEPLPPHVSKMPYKQCYANALLTAQEHGFTYVEGFACRLLTTMHAWCEDDDGRVIDPTWSDDDPPPTMYLGIRMNVDKVAARVVRQGVYGVLPQADTSLLDGDLSALI